MTKRAAGIGRRQGEEAQDNKAVSETAAENAPAQKKEKKQRPVRCIQTHTDREFRREYRDICTALVKKAKGGSIAETRLLLKIGKSDDPKAAKRRGAKSLSEMLLEELKRRQDEREAASEAAGANQESGEGATSGNDAGNE